MAAPKKKSGEKSKRKKSVPKKSAPTEISSPPPSGTADTRVDRFRQNLRCNLTAQELAQHAGRVAHIVSERDLKVEAAKAAVSHIKSQIKELDAELRRLSTEIRDKACYRDVDCERRYLYRMGTVVEVRLDTDEKIFERPMTVAERQLELPGAAKKGPSKKTATGWASPELSEHLQEKLDDPPESGPAPDADDEDPSDVDETAAE
jgi:hypothetical protein